MKVGIHQAALACLETGEPAIVLGVQSVRGSAPRAAGTLMLVTSSNAFGTIGGGHLEWAALDKARALLQASPSPSFPVRHTYALGPSLGQCCGGVVVLEFEKLSVANLPGVRAHEAPLFRLHLFGAGHVGCALATVLSPLRCEVNWIDERDSAFPSSLPERIQVCVSDLPEAEVDAASSGDFYVVMTHRHDLDLRIVERILRRGDAGFIGLIGSQTKRARFAGQLQAKGLDMTTVRCPISPDAMGAIASAAIRKEPGVIALAIAQELLLASQAGDNTKS